MILRLPNPATSWWRSPYFLVPATIAAGTLLGVGIVHAMPYRCPPLGPQGGVLEGVRYLERMRGGASPDEEVPMVVVLHSLGGTPEGYAGGLGGIGKARLILPEGQYDKDSGKSWFGKGLHAVVEAGNTPEALQIWRDAGDRLARFIDAIRQCRPTLGDPIVTGSSQGGEASLLIATEHRHLVHGAVVVNGDMPEPLWSRKMAPTLMIHGTGDTTVPYAWAKAHAEAVIAQGAPLRFESYPSSGHDVTKAESKEWISGVRDMVAEIGG
jgi:phospholipase/carboxylesterase